MNYENAVEPATLYDTFLIGVMATDKYPNAQFAATYNAMGALNEVPFFNIRNKSMVGIAYNNFDSKDKLSFVFHCHSIGVEWICPITDTSATDDYIISVNRLVFANLLAHHAALTLYISQDEKLVTPVPLCPSGTGISGDVAHANDIANKNTTISNYQNGIPALPNRYVFPEPLEIPRGETIRAKINFSRYARTILETIIGPNIVEVATGVTVNNTAGIRLLMFGDREVQQRGALHR